LERSDPILLVKLPQVIRSNCNDLLPSDRPIEEAIDGFNRLHEPASALLFPHRANFDFQSTQEEPQ